MNDFTYHDVRPATVAKLNAICPDIKPGTDVNIPGMGDFCFDGTWQRVRYVREKPAEFLYQILFGDFPGCKGGIAAILRMPPKGKMNWYKVITPAVKRLIRKLGRPANARYQFEYDSGTVFTRPHHPPHEGKSRGEIRKPADDRSAPHRAVGSVNEQKGT